MAKGHPFDESGMRFYSSLSLDRIPRHVYRAVFISFFVLFLCTVSLLSFSDHDFIARVTTTKSTNQADTQTPPSKSVEQPDTPKAVVHGVEVPDHLPTSYPTLKPFPDSPQAPIEADGVEDKRNPWLAAVICAAQDVERRMLIRSTWMRLYAELPCDRRFVIANPGPKWMQTVRLENQTYGDMIVLDHIPEDDMTANTIKTLELYKWLVQRGPRRYQFISKMDTDLWLNARAFWNRYISPRLSDPTNPSNATATVNRTTIGQLYYSEPHRLTFPHGSMYTCTWDMAALLVDLQETHRLIAGEDQLVTRLLQRGGEQAHLVNMNGTEKFDYDDDDARAEDSAWARNATHPTAMLHALYGTDVIAVHQLKDTNLYIKVADHFDENGIKAMTPLAVEQERKPSAQTLERDRSFEQGKSDYYASHMDRIPDSYWSQENGDWICNGVWNLGHEKTGFQKEP